MALTNDQIVTLRAAVQAEPTLADAIANGADYLIAEWCNSPSTKTVWKSSVDEKELMQAFDWTRVDNLSVGKARIWDWMFRFGTVNPGDPGIRSGIDATWVGTAADLAVRAAIYIKCKRLATRAEAVLAVGTGTDASPAVLTFEGTIDANTAGLLRI